jgi:hypothetical protein
MNKHHYQLYLWSFGLIDLNQLQEVLDWQKENNT